ncbi:MAG: glutamate racemase [Coriobacteriia bacterium]|nr:glutamate racemase [Coriobacteriia bacterium]
MSQNAPLGIFDSGLGGLTVAREIAQRLPHESFVYVGDTRRCPYGPRDLSQVEQYVREICTFLQDKGVKLIVIACNTATAAGLELMQREFDIPIIGVIEPGARAAVRTTRNRKVGVIGTVGTIQSSVYHHAVKALDAGCQVMSVATPSFVDMVEEGLAFSDEQSSDVTHGLRVPPNFDEIATDYLGPLQDEEVDTVVLGCTHYPLLHDPIAEIMGDDVVLVSSAEETARDVSSTLQRRGHEALEDHIPTYQFFTTGDLDRFQMLGSKVFGRPLDSLELLDIDYLESLIDPHKE